MDDLYEIQPKNLVSSFLLSLETENVELHKKIVEFKDITCLDEILGSRYSLVFLMDLFFTFENRTINLEALMHEVKFLEGKLSQSKTKPASQFLQPPLQGLWHKHFYDTSLFGITQNVKNALNNYSIPYCQKKIEEAKKSVEEKYMTVEDIPHIVDDVVSRNLQRRNDEQRMTGEWIVYANYQGVNYYLCVAKHQEGDGSIRNRLDVAFLLEFPFLKELLPAS